MGDVVDSNRVVICGAGGALSDIPRQAFPLKRLYMTPFKFGMKRGAKVRSMKRALAKSKAAENFKASRAARRMAARSARQALNDFDRFKLMKAKRKIGVAV